MDVNLCKYLKGVSVGKSELTWSDSMLFKKRSPRSRNGSNFANRETLDLKCVKLQIEYPDSRFYFKMFSKTTIFSKLSFSFSSRQDNHRKIIQLTISRLEPTLEKDF